jgi:transcriptional regulator with XRE-family HTH domain
MSQQENQQNFDSQQTLGDRLRWVREGLGLTLEAFGAEIGYDKSYLSMLERGLSKNPSVKFIEAVCSKFMVFRDWLLTGKGQPVMEDAIVKLASGIDWEAVGSRAGQALAMEAELDIVRVIWLLMKDLPKEQRLEKGTEMMNDPAIKASAKEYWATVFLRASSDSPPPPAIGSRPNTLLEQKQRFLRARGLMAPGDMQASQPAAQKAPHSAPRK